MNHKGCPEKFKGIYVPKIVDHDERRLELVDATWRIIARLGIESATMREIALEAGFANGALKPYFSSKDMLLQFAFSHVFNRTNQRIAAATQDKKGLSAIRAFCVEVLPMDEERVNEARIVIPFWQKAVNDDSKAAIHQASMEQWHQTLLGHLAEARKAGEVTAAVPDQALAGLLLNMLLGAQVGAALPGSHGSTDALEQIEHYFRLLGPG